MKGLAFRTEMVEAIAHGNKTETRRLTGLDVINTVPDDIFFVGFKEYINSEKKFKTNAVFESRSQKERYAIRVPYEEKEIIYVKEQWQDRGWEVGEMVAPAYKALGHEACGWNHNRFMPESAARLFLRVLEVQVDRLDNVGDIGAIREGIVRLPNGSELWKNYANASPDGFALPRTSFFSLWSTIYADHPLKAAGNNPWVFVVKFKVVPKPLPQTETR